MFLKGSLSRPKQEALRDEVLAVMDKAPLFQPTMPKTGKPLSVRMTNCGALGWASDARGGYRYQGTHPVTGKPWPPMPQSVLALWEALSGYPAPPEACLVNFYDETARMGLHRDVDEEDFSAPLISISLGCAALFRLGGEKRGDPTRSFRLCSGDVLVMGGASRLFFHGIGRIYPGTSDLLPDGGRINLTLRRVTKLRFGEGRQGRA